MADERKPAPPESVEGGSLETTKKGKAKAQEKAKAAVAK